jgi:hypothetical protein
MMRHVTSPVLRRLQDEPLAVPDTARQHLAGCARCQAAGTAIAADAAFAQARLVPGLAPDPGADPGPDLDLDREWALLQDRLREPAARAAVRDPWALPRRLAGLSVRTGTVAAVGALALGVGAAAALTTVYAPTKVAPAPVAPGDLRAIAAISGVSTSELDSLPPSGSRQLAFGSLSWTSSGPPEEVAGLAQAFRMTGLSYAPPRLPAGVGAVAKVTVQPQVTATIRFSAAAGAPVAGSTLVVTGGPGLLAQYGSAGSSGAGGKASPVTFAIGLMQRPTATSTGATAGQLEAFLLSQRSLPAALREEIRLLGTSALPVPIPAGVPVQHVTIGGAPGLLVAVPSGAATGVIWENRSGVVLGVAGATSRQDVLNVARQLG